jgi:hypothetical protein
MKEQHTKGEANGTIDLCAYTELLLEWIVNTHLIYDLFT